MVFDFIWNQNVDPSIVLRENNSSLKTPKLVENPVNCVLLELGKSDNFPSDYYFYCCNIAVIRNCLYSEKLLLLLLLLLLLIIIIFIDNNIIISNNMQ